MHARVAPGMSQSPESDVQLDGRAQPVPRNATNTGAHLYALLAERWLYLTSLHHRVRAQHERAVQRQRTFATVDRNVP